jgi:hypothetical protein
MVAETIVDVRGNMLAARAKPRRRHALFGAGWTFRDYGVGCRTEIFTSEARILVSFIWTELPMPEGKYAEICDHRIQPRRLSL